MRVSVDSLPFGRRNTTHLLSFAGGLLNGSLGFRVAIDPAPLKLRLALACEAWTQALPLIPHGSRVGAAVASTT